jgi:hypothetical protein
MRVGRSCHLDQALVALVRRTRRASLDRTAEGGCPTCSISAETRNGTTRGREGDLGSTRRPQTYRNIFLERLFQTDYFSQIIWAFLSSACSLRAVRARSPRGTGGGPTGPNSQSGRSPWA